VVKDFLILNQSLRYKPDLVVWMVTTISLTPTPVTLNYLTMRTRKLSLIPSINIILINMQTELLINQILGTYDSWPASSYGSHSFIANERHTWAATGIDYHLFEYKPLDINVGAGQKFENFDPPNLSPSIFAFDALTAAHKMIGGIPVLMVNEPIYMAPGENSATRYNMAYPHWAYDQYRQFLQTFAVKKRLELFGYVQLIPYDEFTDSIFHITPSGEAKLANTLAPEILHIECP